MNNEHNRAIYLQFLSAHNIFRNLPLYHILCGERRNSLKLRQFPYQRFLQRNYINEKPGLENIGLNLDQN